MYTVLIALYGLIFGSFFNVVGLRVPQGESIMAPPSHCTACQRRLRWYELVPVVSWVVLRGRCRTCRARVSFLYPLIELGTALSVTVFWVRFGWSAEFVVGVFATGVFAVLSAADFAYHRIPDKILLPGIAMLFACRLWFHPLGVWSYIGGAVLGYCLLYLIALVSRGGMGYGDVKLFLFVGLLTGVWGTILTLVAASFIGAVVGLSLRAAGRLAPKQHVAFGPAICLAALAVSLYGEYAIHAYLQLFGLS